MLSILLVLVVEESWIIVLCHEFLGRLVHLHVLHSGRGLARLLVSSSFPFFLRSSVLLHLLELIKDILVVQKRVRELILEFLTLEESFYTALNDGHLQKLVNSRSLSRVALQHHSNQIGNGGREVRWQRRVLALDDFLCQLMQRASVEGRGQGGHLVHEDTHRPDI